MNVMNVLMDFVKTLVQIAVQGLGTVENVKNVVVLGD
jgi:hypothetical protein